MLQSSHFNNIAESVIPRRVTKDHFLCEKSSRGISVYLTSEIPRLLFPMQTRIQD